nr:uncharacterized protein LOC109429587 isoform X2 [Aedes albopictus]
MFILHKTGMDESCYHSTHDYSQHSSIQCSITWFVGHTSKDNPMTDPGLVGAVGQAVGDFCSDIFLRALVYLLSFQVNLFGFTDSAIVTGNAIWRKDNRLSCSTDLQRCERSLSAVAFDGSFLLTLDLPKGFRGSLVKSPLRCCCPL